MKQKNGLVQRVPLFFQTLEREAEHVFIHVCIHGWCDIYRCLFVSSNDHCRQQIIRIAGAYNVNLTEKQISQLISLCRSLEGLDANSLRDRVEQVQNTLSKVSEARTQVVGFVQSLQKAVDSIRSFFDKLSSLFG